MNIYSVVYSRKLQLCDDVMVMSLYQSLEAVAVVPLDGRKGHLHDLVDECGEVGPLKRPLKTRHLIEHAAQCPDVTLCVVGLAFTLGGGEGGRGEGGRGEGSRVKARTRLWGNGGIKKWDT